jgi:hypothetical protein
MKKALVPTALIAVLAVSSAAEAGSYDKRAHAAAASGPIARTLVGLTSQMPCQMEPSPVCGTVNIVMTRKLRRVRQMTIAYEAGCQVPQMYISGLIIAKGFDQRGRRFSKTGLLTQDLGDGLAAVGHPTISGKLNRKHTAASGKFRIVTEIFEAGQKIDTCDSGAVTWQVAKLAR